ncbi:helix-turn-helix domain-containing protein [Tenacibaculum geojense]|uniref:Helix-turn-helix domain-containing protein n=1 Tax=Tenacibaculum geojense TaxID=915352 RepID=A0ABW3JRU9_9FLAO
MTDSEKEYLKAIGKRISKLRRANGFSQLDVCAIIEMEKPNLSSIENGRQNFTALTLKKIAEAINVDVKDFFIDEKNEADNQSCSGSI